MTNSSSDIEILKSKEETNDGKSENNLKGYNFENEEEDEGSQINKKIELEDVFYAYCNTRTHAFQPITSTIYDRILLSQIDAWMDKAKLIGRSDTTFTLTETGSEYTKFRRWRINFDEFNEFLQNLCNLKKLDINEIKMKLLSVGVPKRS